MSRKEEWKFSVRETNCCMKNYQIVLFMKNTKNITIFPNFEKMHSLCLRVTQKAFQLPFFSFFFSSFLALFLEGLAKAFVNVSSFVVQSVCDQDRELEFRVCGYGIHDIHVRIQATVNNNSDGRFKLQSFTKYVRQTVVFI